MLKLRVLTALVFAPALLGLVWLGGLPLEITCLALALLMLWEFLQLTLGPGQRYTKGVGYVLALAWVAMTVGWLPEHAPDVLVPVAALALLTAILLRPEPISAAMFRSGVVALGVLYCGGLIPYLARLREIDSNLGLGLALMALFCTWGADTGAYFAGRYFGKHKLYPIISPAKTVEGAIGGLLAAVGAGFIIRALFGVPLSPLHTIGVGAVAAIFGMAGDLCESMIKRSVGAKDSSKLIPGHGGVLDRFDAVMFSCPAVFVYFTATRTLVG